MDVVCPTGSNLVFCPLNVTGVTVKGPRRITQIGQFLKGRALFDLSLFPQHLAGAWHRVDIQEISVDVTDEKGHSLLKIPEAAATACFCTEQSRPSRPEGQG